MILECGDLHRFASLLPRRDSQSGSEPPHSEMS